ncbi:hypothetical protein J1N35_020233 [Gossypium stocksii]|uniref:Zinc knuckle CX2CX4HX4C domain-containing protein n=1 Tax=Gossypium stocksii TaxID=47602 RepID=A0A9D3VE59_9ROSI|nr:hypothetical protein J1N35_020233 [Gossypium stocksii]
MWRNLLDVCEGNETALADLHIDDGKEDACQTYSDSSFPIYANNFSEFLAPFGRGFNDANLDRVIDGALWMFNNHLLVFHKLRDGEGPLGIQVHDLPDSLISKTIAKQISDFIGRFIDYNAKSITNGVRSHMRIRVRMNVRQPFKRRKKLVLSQSKQIYVNFKYEKLTLFCFLRGRLGHGKMFCPVQIIHGKK